MPKWISWKPGVVEMYLEKLLGTAKGKQAKLSINNVGRWTAAVYSKGALVYIIEFATIYECCAWLKENEVIEWEDQDA